MSGITATLRFGRIAVVTTQHRDGNEIVFGGYAIHYDEAGREILRTEDTPNIVVTLAADGQPQMGLQVQKVVFVG